MTAKAPEQLYRPGSEGVPSPPAPPFPTQQQWAAAFQSATDKLIANIAALVDKIEKPTDAQREAIVAINRAIQEYKS